MVLLLMVVTFFSLFWKSLRGAQLGKLFAAFILLAFSLLMYLVVYNFAIRLWGTRIIVKRVELSPINLDDKKFYRVKSGKNTYTYFLKYKPYKILPEMYDDRFVKIKKGDGYLEQTSKTLESSLILPRLINFSVDTETVIYLPDTSSLQ